ncbi:MAG: hypothetical protein NTV01_14370 [Bacteroidia bacterium]|nr:hypothetical protein [Bacteroidia bacterium]
MKMYKLSIIFILAFCLRTEILSAQTFFEDAKGKSSINLPVGGIIRVNTSDESLKFGYYYNRSDKDVVLGLDASGKSNNGLAPIISNGKLSPEAALNFNLGFKNISTDDSNPSGYDYLNFKIGIGAAKYKLISVDTSYEQQTKSESFNKINLGLSYNYYLNGNMIFGIYGGYDKTNNISGLSKLKVKESTSISTDSTGTIIRTSEEEYTAWKGELKTINQFSLFFDYVYIPDFLNNRVAISLYSRSSFNSSRNQTNGGLGIYLNQKDEPLKIVGGIIYEFEDLFDAKKAGTSVGKRGTIGIVLGYYF